MSRESDLRDQERARIGNTGRTFQDAEQIAGQVEDGTLSPDSPLVESPDS